MSIDVSAPQRLWTFRPTFMGRNVYWRVIHGAKFLLRCETIMGRIATGQTVHTWGETSRGELCMGQKVYKPWNCELLNYDHPVIVMARLDGSSMGAGWVSLGRAGGRSGNQYDNFGFSTDFILKLETGGQTHPDTTRSEFTNMWACSIPMWGRGPLGFISYLCHFLLFSDAHFQTFGPLNLRGPVQPNSLYKAKSGPGTDGGVQSVKCLLGDTQSHIHNRGINKISKENNLQ